MSKKPRPAEPKPRVKPERMPPPPEGGAWIRQPDGTLVRETDQGKEG